MRRLRRRFSGLLQDFMPSAPSTKTQGRIQVKKRNRTRRSIRVHDGNALLTRGILKESLLSAIISRTSQSSQIKQHWNLLVGQVGLWREVEVQVHLTS